MPMLILLALALSALGECQEHHDNGTTARSQNATVEMAVRIDHLDFVSVSGDVQVWLELVNALTGAISSVAGDEVTPEHVALTLDSGSESAIVSIKPPASIPASSVQSNLLNNESLLLTSIVHSIENIDGIMPMSTGVIGASIMREPTVQQPTTPGVPGSKQEDASSATGQSWLVGGVIGGASIAGIFIVVLARCLCWKKPCARE